MDIVHVQINIYDKKDNYNKAEIKVCFKTEIKKWMFIFSHPPRMAYLSTLFNSLENVDI